MQNNHSKAKQAKQAKPVKPGQQLTEFHCHTPPGAEATLAQIWPQFLAECKARRTRGQSSLFLDYATKTLARNGLPPLVFGYPCTNRSKRQPCRPRPSFGLFLFPGYYNAEGIPCLKRQIWTASVSPTVASRPPQQAVAPEWTAEHKQKYPRRSWLGQMQNTERRLAEGRPVRELAQKKRTKRTVPAGLTVKPHKIVATVERLTPESVPLYFRQPLTRGADESIVYPPGYARNKTLDCLFAGSPDARAARIARNIRNDFYPWTFSRLCSAIGAKYAIPSLLDLREQQRLLGPHAPKKIETARPQPIKQSKGKKDAPTTNVVRITVNPRAAQPAQSVQPVPEKDTPKKETKAPKKEKRNAKTQAEIEKIREQLASIHAMLDNLAQSGLQNVPPPPNANIDLKVNVVTQDVLTGYLNNKRLIQSLSPNNLSQYSPLREALNSFYMQLDMKDQDQAEQLHQHADFLRQHDAIHGWQTPVADSHEDAQAIINEETVELIKSIPVPQCAAETVSNERDDVEILVQAISDVEERIKKCDEYIKECAASDTSTTSTETTDTTSESSSETSSVSTPDDTTTQAAAQLLPQATPVGLVGPVDPWNLVLPVQASASANDKKKKTESKKKHKHHHSHHHHHHHHKHKHGKHSHHEEKEKPQEKQRDPGVSKALPDKPDSQQLDNVKAFDPNIERATDYLQFKRIYRPTRTTWALLILAFLYLTAYSYWFLVCALFFLFFGIPTLRYDMSPHHEFDEQEKRTVVTSGDSRKCTTAYLNKRLVLCHPLFRFELPIGPPFEKCLYCDAILQNYALDAASARSPQDCRAYYYSAARHINMTTQMHSDLLDGTLRAMAAYDLTRPSMILRATWLTVLFGFTPAFAAKAAVKPVKADFTVAFREVPHEPTCWYSLIGQAAYDLNVTPVTPDRRSAMNMAFGAINRIGVDNSTNCQIEKYGPVIDEVLSTLFKVELEYPVLDYEHMARWIESRPYDQNQKNALHQCLDSLCTWDQEIFEGMEEFKTKAFIKNEAYTDYKYARLICAGGPLRKLLYGPLFQPLSDWFFHQPWSIKHYPHEQRGAEIVKRLGITGHFYVTDHSAFECSATTRVQDMIEAKVYRKYVRQEYMPLLNYIIYGGAEGMQEIFGKNVYIRTPVVRNSGEMNTSLGNSILNLVTIHVAARMLNNEVVAVLVEGDDGLFTLKNYVPPEELAAVMSELGMRIKVEYHESVFETSFCSTKMSPIGVGIDWVRNFVRFPWKTTLITNAKQELAAKAGAYGLMAKQSAIAKALVQYYDSTVAWFADDTYHREKLEQMGESGHIQVPIPAEHLQELKTEIDMNNLILDAETNDMSVGQVERVVKFIKEGKIAQAINAFYEARPVAACWESAKSMGQKLVPEGGVPGKHKVKAAYSYTKNVLNEAIDKMPKFDAAQAIEDLAKHTSDLKHRAADTVKQMKDSVSHLSQKLIESVKDGKQKSEPKIRELLEEFQEYTENKYKEFKDFAKEAQKMGPERTPEFDLPKTLNEFLIRTLKRLMHIKDALMARTRLKGKISIRDFYDWMITAFTDPLYRVLSWTLVDLLFPFSIFMWVYEPYMMVILLILYWFCPRRLRTYVTLIHLTIYYETLPSAVVIAVITWNILIHALAGNNHFNKF